MSLEKTPALQRAIDGIGDENTKQEVRKLVDEAMKAIVVMMIVKSLITMFALLPIGVVVVCAELIRSGIHECARSIFRRSKIMIQLEAERVGSSADAVTA
jgi:hypothetical protein